MHESSRKMLYILSLYIAHPPTSAVTVTAPTWKQLQTLWAIRRLYQPTGMKLSSSVKLQLTRNFAAGLEATKDKAEIVQLVDQVGLHENVD